MANEDLTRHLYSGHAGSIYHHQHRALPPEAQLWVSRLRARKIQPHVGLNDSVFEFGAGFGWNLASLQCASKTAFDVDPSLRPAVEKFGIEFLDDLRLLKNRTFQLILCHHVLEHIPDPIEKLQLLRHLLKPGGLLLVFVPFEKESRYKSFHPNEPNHHLFSWNAQTLGNLIQGAGFQVDSVKIAKFRLDRFASRLSMRIKTGEWGFRMIRFLGLLVAPEYEIQLVARKGPTS